MAQRIHLAGIVALLALGGGALVLGNGVLAGMWLALGVLNGCSYIAIHR